MATSVRRLGKHDETKVGRRRKGSERAANATTLTLGARWHGHGEQRQGKPKGCGVKRARPWHERARMGAWKARAMTAVRLSDGRMWVYDAVVMGSCKRTRQRVGPRALLEEGSSAA